MKPTMLVPTIQPTNSHGATPPGYLDTMRLNSAVVEQPDVTLVARLCRALSEDEISYCHWKSNNALDRSANGDNDLDLLISRADAQRFCSILGCLGFKQVQAPPEKHLPAVMDFFGYDQDVDKWIHVHAHFQLILGHDMTKNYRLALEKAYLGSAVQDALFRVPEVEFEYVVFIIRMILKHATWDAVLGREGTLKRSERKELIFLQERIQLDRVSAILKQHLPYIDPELFGYCVQASQPGSSIWLRIKAGHRLQKALQINAERTWLVDTSVKLWRRTFLALRRRIVRSESKYRLMSGGACIAIVGGDGAGKSTAIDALHAWLSKYFEATRVHMGKPVWSPLTITLRSILKLGQLLNLYPVESPMRETLEQKSVVSPGYPWLIRELCTARDRYHTYLKARRFAAKGGLVLLDRLPLPQIQLMDGPRTERFMEELASQSRTAQLLRPRQNSLTTKLLIKPEKDYYQRIVLPELLIVLRLDPEIAVQRKTEDDSSVVRERSIEIWQVDWQGTDAHLIDAGKSKKDVLAELKALIWSEL